MAWLDARRAGGLVPLPVFGALSFAHRHERPDGARHLAQGPRVRPPVRRPEGVAQGVGLGAVDVVLPPFPPARVVHRHRLHILWHAVDVARGSVPLDARAGRGVHQPRRGLVGVVAGARGGEGRNGRLEVAVAERLQAEHGAAQADDGGEERRGGNVLDHVRPPRFAQKRPHGGKVVEVPPLRLPPCLVLLPLRARDEGDVRLAGGRGPHEVEALQVGGEELRHVRQPEVHPRRVLVRRLVPPLVVHSYHRPEPRPSHPFPRPSPSAEEVQHARTHKPYAPPHRLAFLCLADHCSRAWSGVFGRALVW